VGSAQLTSLRDALAQPGTPLAVVIVPGTGAGLAWPGGSSNLPDVAELLELETLGPRWVWWSARQTAPALLDVGLRPARSWDLGTVGRLLHGLRRDDEGAVWAAAHELSQPPAGRDALDLFDLHGESGEALRDDGHLSREWLRGLSTPAAAQRWAELALALYSRQESFARSLPDPRARPTAIPMVLLTAHAESGAALLAVELETDGLPIDSEVAGALLTDVVGARPTDLADEQRQREARDAVVLALFPSDPVDLRSPAQVRSLLARVGVDLPDTRSWRLEPYAASSPAVAALLAWRKAERMATTYGWRWLDENVGSDGRLRGAWSSADAAAGRMTAQAGLHNLPTEMRTAVRAQPGHVLVRADLGQIEPRVLAAVSGDPALTAAARETDMYAPVAAALRCDRPTAKVAVLAAMYGQTSGTAGAALRDMDRTYGTAMAYLRSAEAAGLSRRDIRTYGGRLLRLTGLPAGEPVGEHVAVSGGYGRFARNAMIQGAAAELFKAWAVTVRSGLAGTGGQIVLCLHDELLLHVPAAMATEAGALLVQSLERTTQWWAAGSGVRFVAEVTTGTSWAETH
jgi:DNA polymerase-1